MDNSKFTEETSLQSMLSSFIDSYAQRDKSIEFSVWLGNRLQQEIPDMSEEAGNKLAGDIIEGITSYDKTLDELNHAVDAGQSKEEWFAERLAETYADMPLDTVGGKLQQIESDLTASNIQLMREINETQIGGASTADAGSIEWNEYSIKDMAYELGKQVILAGMAVAANVVKDKIQNSEAVDIADIIKETLQDGMENNPEEIKAVVAGAIKATVENGLVDIPDETIFDIAGVVVESAVALFDVACGKSTMMDAVEKIGRAVVVAGCRYCAVALKGYLMTIPYGPLVVGLLGGLLDYVMSHKFTEKIYTVIRNAAVATWKGVNEIVTEKTGYLENKVLN